MTNSSLHTDNVEDDEVGKYPIQAFSFKLNSDGAMVMRDLYFLLMSDFYCAGCDE